MEINILRKEDGYSLIENQDQEQVKAIKAIKPQDTFDYSFNTGCKIEQDLGNGQFLVKDDEGKFITLSKEKIDKARKETLLNQINNEHLAWEFLSNLRTLYTRDGFARIKFLGATKEQIQDPKLRMRSYSGMGRVGYSEQGLKISTYNGFSIVDTSENQWQSIAFAHFDEDGNVWCRDYNIDIGEMAKNECKITKELIMQELSDYIEGEEFKTKGNKFYSDKWCYVVDTTPRENEREGGPTVLRIKRLSSRGNNRYGTSREGGTSTLPKTATPATKRDILALVAPVIAKLEFAPGDISDFFQETQDKPQEIEVFNADKHSPTQVYDWEEESSQDWYMSHMKDQDRKNLLKYCLELSQGFDRSSQIEKLVRENLLDGDNLPSYSFDKGEAQPDNSDFLGLIKLPHGCRFLFEVEEGDVCEITWAHSIYQTDVVFFRFVGIESPAIT